MLKNSLIICFSLVMAYARAQAQNVSSPYSILGIGDMDNTDQGRYNASGGSAVSRREPGYYNPSNPASLTSMYFKSINVNLAFSSRVSVFKLVNSDTFTSPSKDFILKRINVAFKVSPKTGIAFGLKPYSTVSYQSSATSSSIDGGTNYIKSVDGSGGLYQAYFSVGKELGKHLSAGLTTSWLFGSLQKKTTYTNTAIGLDITKNEYHFYNAAGLQLGLQYYTGNEAGIHQSIGFTGAVYTQLKGQYTVGYLEDTVPIKTLDPETNKFKLPVSLVLGYSIFDRNNLSFHLQTSYDKWPKQPLAYTNSYTRDAMGAGIGMEYAKKTKVQNGMVENFYLAWGVKMQHSYLVINNNHVSQYAITLGGGKNISRFLGVNAGLELGKRGQQSLNQVTENYGQFNVGLTIKDFWFGTKKFGQFK